MSKVEEDFAEEIARLAAMRDEDIDLSDMPESTGPGVHGMFEAREKTSVWVRLDDDVAAWFAAGSGGDARINRLLRYHMLMAQQHPTRDLSDDAAA